MPHSSHLRHIYHLYLTLLPTLYDIFSNYFDVFNIYYIQNYCTVEIPAVYLQRQRETKGFDEGLNPKGYLSRV